MKSEDDMTDEEFQRTYEAVIRGISALRRACKSEPSLDRVEKAVRVASTACCLAEPATITIDCDVNGTLNLSRVVTFEGESAAAVLNRHMQVVASKLMKWPVEVSVAKNDGNTFPRSVGNDSELEKFLGSITLGTAHPAEETKPDRKGGTDSRKFPGLVANESHAVAMAIEEAKKSGRTFPEEFQDSDDWMSRALKLPPLGRGSLDAWAEVIVKKAEQEGGLVPEDAAPDWSPLKGWSPFVDAKWRSFRTYQKSNGGARFRSYLLREIRNQLQRQSV